MASTKTPETTVKIAELPVPIIIDTGSSVNILNYYSGIYSQCHSKTTANTFLVTKDNNTSLPSYNTSIALGLLNININSISADHPDPRIA